MATTTRLAECTASALYMSLELGSTKWVVVSTTSLGQRPRSGVVRAGDCAGLAAEVARAKRRFGVSAAARVFSCYEAGRDGLWLHRWRRASRTWWWIRRVFG